MHNNGNPWRTYPFIHQANIKPAQPRNDGSPAINDIY